MTILAALTPGALADFFDARSLVRGLEYARSGQIGPPELTKLTDTTVIATALAHGTAPAPYSVHLYAEYVRDQFWMTTTPAPARSGSGWKAVHVDPVEHPVQADGARSAHGSEARVSE